MMEQHFVTFYSPGTFVAETTDKPIDSWDVDAALDLMAEVTERHGAKPYGFRFITRSRADNDLDSHVSDRSGMYYVDMVVRTLAELQRDNKPEERILRSNMESNGYDAVVQTTKGWLWTQPLQDGDQVISSAGRRRKQAELTRATD